MKNLLTKFLLATPLVVPSHAALIFGGDFEIYKPGTNIPASFPAGSFGRGVGSGLEVGNGTSEVIYSDGSPNGTAGDGTPDFDLPGWVDINGGLNDSLANGVGGSTGLNFFAAWGGDQRIETASPVGSIQSGLDYTITVQVSGPGGNFAGPITEPLAFHLVANGVQLTPSSMVDPDPNLTGFQTISRTYDAASVAGVIGQDVTIILGVEDANNAGNRVIFDNVEFAAIPEPGSTLLLGWGIGTLAVVRRRRK